LARPATHLDNLNEECHHIYVISIS
jgi:hypothetical protein